MYAANTLSTQLLKDNTMKSWKCPDLPPTAHTWSLHDLNTQNNQYWRIYHSKHAADHCSRMKHSILIWAMKNPSWAQHINHCRVQQSDHYCSFQRLLWSFPQSFTAWLHLKSSLLYHSRGNDLSWLFMTSWNLLRKWSNLSSWEVKKAEAQSQFIHQKSRLLGKVVSLVLNRKICSWLLGS